MGERGRIDFGIRIVRGRVYCRFRFTEISIDRFWSRGSRIGLFINRK